MSRRVEALPICFTAKERELIRHEMDRHFSQYPKLADGIFLRTWRGGPQKNEPENPAGGAHHDGSRAGRDPQDGKRGARVSSPRRGLGSFVGYCWTSAP